MGYPDMNLDFDYSSTNAAEFPQPGTKVRNADGLDFVCVYNAGASAIADNDVVGVYNNSGTTTDGYVSTTATTMLDLTDGTTVRSACAGIAVGAIASGAYGWLWCGGFDSAGTCTTDTNVAAGHPLVLADGAKVASPASTAISAHHAVFGYAAGADDSAAALTGLSLTSCYF